MEERQGYMQYCFWVAETGRKTSRSRKTESFNHPWNSPKPLQEATPHARTRILESYTAMLLKYQNY